MTCDMKVWRSGPHIRYGRDPNTFCLADTELQLYAWPDQTCRPHVYDVRGSSGSLVWAAVCPTVDVVSSDADTQDVGRLDGLTCSLHVSGLRPTWINVRRTHPESPKGATNVPVFPNSFWELRHKHF